MAETETLSPPTAEPAVQEASEENGDAFEQPKMSDEEVAQLLQELGEATQTVVSDDVSFAFVPEEAETLYIPTGRFDDSGRPVAVPVKVRDPCRPELPTQYLNAVARIGTDKAALGLWQAFIVEPKALKNPKNYERTTTSFRATLTERLLVKAGINGDFLAARLATQSQAPPVPRKSSTTSVPPLAVCLTATKVAFGPVIPGDGRSLLVVVQDNWKPSGHTPNLPHNRSSSVRSINWTLALLAKEIADLVNVPVVTTIALWASW